MTDSGSCYPTLARRAIEHYFNTGQILKPALEDLPEDGRQRGACFVTLEKNGQLRGCIGSLKASRPLGEDVTSHAVDAAFRDPRFPPLEPQELAELEIHISVLTPPEPFPVKDESDLLRRLRPGEDGLILEDQGRCATFLPSVWEQLPESESFVRHLKRKAGLPDAYWSDSIRFQRYRVREYG